MIFPFMQLSAQGPRSNFEIGEGGAPLMTGYWGGGSGGGGGHKTPFLTNSA